MASTTNIELILARIAANHRGLIPTATAIEQGVSDRTITRRRQSGLLAIETNEVSRLNSIPCTPLTTALAAALSTPGAWVSHRSAALALGIPLPLGVAIAEISVTGRNRHRIRGVIDHRQQFDLKSFETEWRWNARFPRPGVCVVELASVLNTGPLELALDHVLHQHRMKPQVILATLDRRAPRGRGSRMLRDLLNERIDGFGMIRSWLELELRGLIRAAGLPAPIMNHEVTLPDGPRFLDAAWPKVRVAIEGDSWQWHANPTDWGKTRIRDRQLQAADWIIIPCVKADTRDPRALIAAVRAAFLLREHQREVTFPTMLAGY
jgi:hypothetical protein